MKLRVHHRWESKLPADDDHPYRTGAWRPNLVEHDADELDVIEGRIPDELAGKEEGHEGHEGAHVHFLGVAIQKQQREGPASLRH